MSKLGEAKTQLLTARENYTEACRLSATDRADYRMIRYQAYQALKEAEIDLIDIAIDQAEEQTGHRIGNYESLIKDSVLRRKAADLALCLREVG